MSALGVTILKGFMKQWLLGAFVGCLVWQSHATANTAAISANAPSNPLVIQRKTAEAIRDPQEALRAFGQLERSALAAKDSEVAAYAILQQGICHQRVGHMPQAASAWQRLRQFRPESEHAAKSLALEAKLATTEQQRDRLHEQLLSKHPNSPETATVLFDRGQAAFDQRDYAAAVKWWDNLVTRFPRHTKVVSVNKSLEIARLAVIGKEEEADGLALMARADKLYDKAEFGLAAGLYRQALARLGGQEEAAGRATLRMAQCQFALGDTRQAMQTLEAAVRRLPAQGAKLLGHLVEQSGGNPQMDGIRQRATEMLLARFPRVTRRKWRCL